MKTWTNPSVEELEVKLTAQGDYIEWIEKLPYLPDFNISGAPETNTPEPEEPGKDPVVDEEGKEEGSPS